MSAPTIAIPTHNLVRLGLRISDSIHYQLSPLDLAFYVRQRGEGEFSGTGALVIQTGEFTGRSPKDKFIVSDEITEDTVDWNDFNTRIGEDKYEIIFKRVTDYLNTIPDIWVRDCYACANPEYRLNIRVINETPAMNLFAYNMFLRPTEEELEKFKPDWHVIAVPGLRLEPKECGTRQYNATVVSFKHKMILIAGSGYTGEIKKGVFTILNYVLPRQKKVLSMHCAANIGKQGDTALFFGLSGTGKTTLSADPNRRLIGDDEHGWAQDSIFNFEGGCYAKCINLREDKEPAIFHAIRMGALVENVLFFPDTNRINFDDGSVTENTRVSYPMHYIKNALKLPVGKIPRNIFFLTCDAYGVLPPISKLSSGQAMYQFISGYTAKVAGTETGITEPKPTFSACFGAPFLPLHPAVYAEMLGKKIEAHQVQVWLINTGWTGGPYLKGKRIQLAHTRAMITAALNGSLEKAEYENHEIFGLAMPKTCLGVPAEILNPANAWPDKRACREETIRLSTRFIRNFEKYAGAVSAEILGSGPKIETFYLKKIRD
jgi:phosphoenolpyruvate carboxykinase (ATP)